MNTSLRPSSDHCPVCAATGSVTFYSIAAAPVTCASVFDSREAALAVPNGVVSLAVCQSCSFIFNTSFDSALGALSARYESSQAASAHFSTFAKGLARAWIDTYGLQGRTVLEVGCGGGDFLRMLVQEGVGQGIGIDPCCEPSSDPGSPPIRWIADNFDERYLDLEADALVCRHTLEHIQDVGAFLQMLRRWAERDPKRVLLFELPASERIFVERAFWDIYYEHCSYFTAATVKHAFERYGFELLRVDHAYEGQYLIVEARLGEVVSGGRHTGGRHAGPEDVANVTGACMDFSRDVAGSIERFTRRAHALAAEHPPLMLWQGASKTVGLLTALHNPDWIAGAVDLSPQRHDKFLPGSGLPVFAPAKLLELRPQHIVLMNPVYLAEVQVQVRAMGLPSEVRSVNDLLA